MSLRVFSTVICLYMPLWCVCLFSTVFCLSMSLCYVQVFACYLSVSLFCANFLCLCPYIVVELTLVLLAYVALCVNILIVI